MEMFARNLGVKVIRVDAESQFWATWPASADPEAKRKIIGREFHRGVRPRRASSNASSGWPRAPSTRT
jgi:GMP synthase PP-ATPase subunit